jgi:hypothetical protein
MLEQIVGSHPGRIHPEHARPGKSCLQQPHEVRAIFDQREVALAHTALQQRFGEDAGTRAQFEHRAGGGGDLAGNQAGEVRP